MTRRHPDHAAACKLNSALDLDVQCGCDCTGYMAYPPLVTPEDWDRHLEALAPFEASFPELKAAPTLVAFTGANVNDIPSRLRAWAERIERGEESVVAVAYASIDGDNQVHAGAFGVCHDARHCAGILAAGIGKLTA